jgi:hypothetical protein
MFLPILFALATAIPLWAADLSAVNIQLHDYEDGPPIPAGQAFRPSETVYLSFQVSGFQATEDDHIQLSYEIVAADPAKRPLGLSKTGKIEAELAPEDKKKGKFWMPKVRFQIQLPITPAPGVYNIRIHLDDKIDGAKHTVDVPFHVEAAGVAPSNALTIQNFRFLRSESDKDRLPEGGAFRPGDAVWARFDITGYKFGPNNRYEVKYGLALNGAAGKSLFSNPDAAQDKSESFYPRTFIPGEFSLNLDKNIKPGDYTLVIFLSDPIGNQNFESAHVFRVE